MLTRNAAVAIALALLLAAPAAAALSKEHNEWRNGPAQWIFTEEEKKAWKALKTDEAAVKFIDLFWVRRDPTPGTPANEYRNEHLTRVKFADEKYTEPRKRGALTDRGRALVVLGFPAGASENMAESGLQQQASAEGYDASAGAQGAKDTWFYDRTYAMQLGLPRLEVVFIQDAGTKRVTRDLTKRDYPAAEPRAIKAAVVNPNITELPEWAPYGGLAPKITVTVPGSEITPAPSAVSLETTAEIKPTGAMLPVGASRLSLLKDVYGIDSETKIDPFTTMATVDAFGQQDELGWAAQYCAATEDEPTLKFILHLTGKAGNEVIDRAAPEDELVPDRIKALPGCYMLRGAIPLADMSPGTYQLAVTIEDPAHPGASHKLTKEFRIE